jgi:hypothetical protein
MREKSIEHWESMRQYFLDNIDNAVEMMQELIRQANELEDKVKELEDAAEFEARVAAKLTGLSAAELPCYPNFLCLFSAKHLGIGCKDCFLKHARLAVEAEIEKE